MSKIICATKAAQNSRALHEAAFRLAKKLELDLEFLHVIAVPDYEDLMEPLQDAVRSELHWLVHSLTRISRQRTGLTQIIPTVAVIAGSVKESIIRHIEDEDVEVLIMGSPNDQPTTFTLATFETFLVEANQANVRVELVQTV